MYKTQQLVIGMAVALVALYYTVRNVSLEELFHSFSEVNWFYVFLTFFLMAVANIPRAMRWRLLLSPFKDVKVTSLFSPMMVGFMGSFLPGRAGEILRAYLAGKKHNISFSGAFSTIVVERLCDLIIVLLMFIWAFIVNKEAFSSDVVILGISLPTILQTFAKIAVVLITVISVFIYLLVSHKDKLFVLVNWIIRPIPSTWKNKIKYLIDEFRVGLMVVKNFPTLIKIILLSLLVWLPLVLAFYPLALGYGVQNLSLNLFILIRVMVSVFITALPTPAFLGSFNAGVFVALHEIMGESEVLAVSFGMVAWAMNTLVVFLAGTYFIIHDHLSLKKIPNLGEIKSQINLEKNKD